SPFLDGPRSFLRCCAATSRGAPAPGPAASCRRSRRSPRRGTTVPSRSSTSWIRAATTGRFSGVPHWPVLGVPRGVAPPVRRVHIPKGDGTETRPIGIPTFEDKVLQRAVAMVIGEVYEQSFHDFSYGFRPGRSAHQALDAIQHAAWQMKGGWLV